MFYKISEKKLSYIFFVIAYVLFSIYWIAEKVIFPEIIKRCFLYLCPLFLILSFFTSFDKYKKEVWISIFFILLISLISIFYSRNSRLFMTFAFIICFRNFDFNKFIKFDFAFKIIITISLIILCFLGLAENVIISRTDSFDVRYSLGFFHPNTLGIYVLIILMEYVYLKFDNLSIMSYLIIFLIGFWMFKITDSRAAYLSILLLILITLCYKEFLYKIKFGKIFKDCLCYLFIILLLISYVLTLNYKYTNSFMKKVNSMSSGRVELANYFYTKYGAKLFGSYLEEVDLKDEKYITLDNGYMDLLIECGLLNTILCCILNIICIKKILKEENVPLLICIVILEFYCLMENTIFSIYINSFLFYLSNVIYQLDKNGDLT